MAAHTLGVNREIVLCATRKLYDRVWYVMFVARKCRMMANFSLGSNGCQALKHRNTEKCRLQ